MRTSRRRLLSRDVTDDDYRNRSPLCLREAGDALEPTDEDVILKRLIRRAGS